MANIFYPKHIKNKGQGARKGACFSVTMSYAVEKRLREIQAAYGLNSRSQAIVFLVNHYDREERAFEGFDKFSKSLERLERLMQNDNAKLAEQQNLPYNNNN